MLKATLASNSAANTVVERFVIRLVPARSSRLATEFR